MFKIFINAAVVGAMATAAYSSAEREDPRPDSPPLSPSHLQLAPSNHEGLARTERLAQVMTERSVAKIKEMNSLYVRILSDVRAAAISAVPFGGRVPRPLPVDSLLNLNESDAAELEKRNSAIKIIYALSSDDLLTYEGTNDYETDELAIRRSVGEITSTAAMAFSEALTTERESKPLSDIASSIDKFNWSITTVENAITAYNASGTGKIDPMGIDTALEMASRFLLVNFNF